MNEKYKMLLTDIIIFGLGALGSKIILFLLVPLYTHTLSESEYGIADLVVTSEQLLLPFFSLTIYNGLLRFGMTKKIRENALNCATVMFCIGSCIAVLLTPFMGLYRPIAEWKWYLCIFIIVSFAWSNTFIYLKVKGNNKIYAILSILKTLILASLNVVFLVVLKTGIRGYILSNIIACLVTAVFAFSYGKCFVDLKHSKFDKHLFKAMVLFSVPYILNDISWWVIHSSDKIMVEWMLGSVSLGIYTAAAKIPSLINALATVFTQAWGISSIKEYDSDNDATFYARIFKYLTIVVFGACICCNIIIKQFMAVYVGKTFADAWLYVPLLLVSAAFASISSFVGALYGAARKSKNMMWTALAGGITNIIINFIFIKMCGVWGAVIGTIVAQILIALLRMVNLRSYIDVDYNLRTLLSLMLIVILQAILVGLNLNALFWGTVCFIVYILLVKKELLQITKITYSKMRSMLSRK